MVKKAFNDPELRAAMKLSSANSINVARFLPQSFYYFGSYEQLEDKSKPVVYSCPSGNFGNLTGECSLKEWVCQLKDLLEQPMLMM